MDKKIIIMFQYNGKTADVEIPTDITADELIHGLNRGFNLGIDVDAYERIHMRSDNPIALIKGDISIEDLGLRNGSSVYFE